MPAVQICHAQAYPWHAGHAVTVFCSDCVSTSKLLKNSGKGKPGLRTAWTTILPGKGWLPLELFGTCNYCPSLCLMRPVGIELI